MANVGRREWRKTEEESMFTFDTTDQKEVRRFRIAQFNGRVATVKSDGSTITGHVRSVLEHKSSVPVSWSITLITEPRISAGLLRPVSLGRAFTEDLY
jgi:hypothetical protein